MLLNSAAMFILQSLHTYNASVEASHHDDIEVIKRLLS